MKATVKIIQVPKQKGCNVVSPKMLIVGEGGYIVSDDDCVHNIYELHENAGTDLYPEPVETATGRSFSCFPHKQLSVNLEELKMFTVSDCDLPKFIHYFGIKDRVLRNYKLLQKSAKKIGAEVNWPAWHF